MQRKCARQRGQLLLERLEHGRVEGVGGLDAPAGDLLRDQLLLQRGDGVGRAGQHTGVGRVDDRQVDGLAQEGLHGGFGQRDGQHGACGQGLDQLRTPGEQQQGILQTQHAGQGGGDVLAQAVAQQRLGSQSPVQQQLRQGSERVRPRLESTEPIDVVNAAVERKRPRLAVHRIELDLARDLPFVEIDPILIEQALGQILENAAKYSPSGSTVRRTSPGSSR